MKDKYKEGVEKLEQLEDLLYRLEHGQSSGKTQLALARVVYFLLERWCREHDRTNEG